MEGLNVFEALVEDEGVRIYFYKFSSPRMVVNRSKKLPMTDSMITEDEIDEEIALLKEELDYAAKLAKAKLKDISS